MRKKMKIGDVVVVENAAKKKAKDDKAKLKGKTIAQMSDKELREFVTLLGQMVGAVDDKGNIL